MATPVRQFDAALDQERLLDVVRTLVAELGRQSAIAVVNPMAHLDQELGLGSLERVELLLRLEKTFGTRLDERVLAEAETVEDLISALSVAQGAAAASSPGATVAPRAHTSASSEIAQGIPDAQSFQDVLRHRGRVDAAITHLIFYQDDVEAESSALTFGELLAGAERVAAEMTHRGIGRGDRVAIMLPTSRDFFFTFAGTLLAGATPVPIYPPFRADRIADYAKRQSAILANAGARLLVTFREGASVAKLLKPLVPSLEGVADAAALAESRVAAPLGRRVNARCEDLALLQYTSGSTGNPKGVMLTHANLLANVRAIGEAIELRNDDVGVSWLPLYHDMGLIGAWLMPLYFGLPVVVLSPLAFLSRPVRWLRAIDRYRGTVGAAPNFAYELAAAKISDEDLQDLDVSSWRAALNGAEPVLPATLDRFSSRFARYGFRREAILPVYGLAEASLAVTIPPVGRGPRVDRVERTAFECDGAAVPAHADDANVISFVSAGLPIPGHEVRIADERGEDAGERVEGQLWFRGLSTTQGYYGNASATAALFPAGAAAGWMNSGDRAYQAEGELYITGRMKDIIIHAGRNLYPHEIEDFVAQVPGVRKGCVVAFGAEDPRTGTERLVVIAETRENDAAARSRIAQAINAQVSTALGLPPDIVQVVGPNAIPKTSSGKLQRDATKKRFLSGELDSRVPPAWLQITRLAAKSSVGRIRRALRRTTEIAYGCYTLMMFGIVLIPAWFLVLISPTRKMASRVTTGALRTFLAVAGWRVRVEGRENIAEHVPRMFVSNHASYADVVLLTAALGTDFHFVAKQEVQSMLFFRTFLRKLGHFAFNRQDSRARLEQADQIEQTLRLGESVFVFPEGTFTAQPGILPFHLGAFKAAIAAHRQIVPIALNGTRRLLRDGTWLPRRSNVTITICPPILPESDASDWHEIVRVRDEAREIISRFANEPLL
jgi:1-acyl-sn-glycerol-3-phosphate acyltransferase